MSDGDVADHWDEVWSTRSPEESSWHQSRPEPSLSLIMEHCPARGGAVDVGGGVSGLAPRLLDAGFDPVTVLDISAAALDRARVEWNEPRITFATGDVRTWRPAEPVVLWHDRALLHFMVDDIDLAAYVDSVDAAILPGGTVVVATFGPDGPTVCSGLEVRRHGPADLARAFAPRFELVASIDHVHHTPWDAPQSFTYAVLRRS